MCRQRSSLKRLLAVVAAGTLLCAAQYGNIVLNAMHPRIISENALAALRIDADSDSGDTVQRKKLSLYSSRSLYHARTGCAVCMTPELFDVAMPNVNATHVVCQSFWHKKYSDWEACRTAALAERAAFRQELCSCCSKHSDSPTSTFLTPPKRGIAFGVTGGTQYISMIAVAILQLRSPAIGYVEGIEVFVDSEPLRELCVNVLAPHGAECIVLPVKVRIGFAAKLIAARESSFDEVMMLDADTLFLINPSILFNDAAFRAHGVLMWSDYFGKGCRQPEFDWDKDPETNPDGKMLCGQTAWKQHVVWPATSLPYDTTSRLYTQEASTSQVLFNKRQRNVRVAIDLSIWMTESVFFANTMYGDKDAIRVAFLAAGIGIDRETGRGLEPIWMLPDAPSQIVRLKSGTEKWWGTTKKRTLSTHPGYQIVEREFFQGNYNGKAMTIDQVKKAPHERPSVGSSHRSAYLSVIQPKPMRVPRKKTRSLRDLRDGASYCAPGYNTFDANMIDEHFDAGNCVLDLELYEWLRVIEGHWAALNNETVPQNTARDWVPWCVGAADN